MSLIISGVIDGPLSGGIPKAIEITVLADIADLSLYGLGSANNGGGTNGQEFDFVGSASAGDKLYIASEAPGFTAFFGFAPTLTTGAASINGDDAIELFFNGTVIDTFGEIDVDGTGTAWEYMDGWAYRKSGTAASATFNLADWTFSGPNALDGETTNASATTAFPIGTFTPGGEPPVATPVINEFVFNHDGTDTAEFVELKGAADTDYSNLSFVVIEGDAGSTLGKVSAVVQAGTTNADGYWASEFFSSVFQNGSQTLLLVDGFTGAKGDLIDVDGDGVVDNAPWTSVLDSVAVLDGGANDVAWSETVLAPGFAGSSFTVGGASRLPDGVDTDSVSDWMRNDFSGAGLPGFTGSEEPGEAVNTPGAENREGELQPEKVLISAIQGSNGTQDGAVAGQDDISAMNGQFVSITAVVTADFQDGLLGSQGDLNGFFVQEELADWDGDALTSEGIFIFDGFDSDRSDVKVGDLVTITGFVNERFGETQIRALSVEVDADADVEMPTAIDVTFPVATYMIDRNGNYVANLEAYEGMLVNIPQSMTITEMFNLDRFGEYRVSDQRYEQFTQSNLPSVSGFDTHLQQVAKGSILLDDGLGVQNPAEIRVIDGNNGVLTAEDVFRMGDAIGGITGVLGYSFDEFRLQNGTGTYEALNPRPDAPEDVGGNFKVASANVLNYFTTLDLPDAVTDIGLDPRGADTAEELERQATKIVEALTEIDADVFGLVEIENDFEGEDFAIKDLVARMNAKVGAEVYGFVDPGQHFVGTDAIANALVYRTDRVETVGEMAILTVLDDGRNFLDPLGAGRDLNRAAIAQTFVDKDTGQMLTVSVNHLKSKGSTDGFEGEADGQGNSSASRTAAAEILADWMASNPTGVEGVERQIILGDLNAYAKEDPIRALEAEGWTDLARLSEPDAYSYVFDGQIGTLDYAMANAALLADFTGATEWHINADEPDALDYDTSNNDPALYAPDATRFSDHDPVVAGFAFYKEIEGGTKGDVLVGTAAWDDIQGFRGNDLILGGEGNDRLRGGLGNDDVFGGTGDDLIDGGLGNDKVFAGAGDDTILLGQGNNDKVWGEEGADTFVFAPAVAADGHVNKTSIFGFEADADMIDIGGLEIEKLREHKLFVSLTLEGDGDVITLWGVSDVDDIQFVDPLVG